MMLRRLSLAFALSIGCTTADAAAPKPSPAMWKIESGGTTVYFLGSMHVLPDGLEWMTPVIERAMSQSDVFYFEIVMSSRSARSAQSVLAKEAYLPAGKTLSGMLSRRGREDLRRVAMDLGLDLAQLDRLRPWTAGIAIGAAASRTQSYSHGADMRVAQYSQERQKSRRYFETAPDQMVALAKLDNVAEFETSLREMRRTPEMLNRMAMAWVTGDLEKLDAVALSGLNDSPDTRKVILDERNQAWAKQFPSIMLQKRTFFVTVGVAHLFGPGSLVELLCGQKLPVQHLDTATGRTRPACTPATLARAAG
jgi:uncharacterized protein YbaP (TraB family)